MQYMNENEKAEMMKAWEDILGTPPEPRKPGDMTCPEIVDLWKINQAARS